MTAHSVPKVLGDEGQESVLGVGDLVVRELGILLWPIEVYPANSFVLATETSFTQILTGVEVV